MKTKSLFKFKNNIFFVLASLAFGLINLKAVTLWAQDFEESSEEIQPVFFDVSMEEMQNISQNTFNIYFEEDSDDNLRIKFSGHWPAICAENPNFTTQKDPSTGDLILKMQVSDDCLISLQKKSTKRVPLSEKIIKGPKFLIPLQFLKVAGDSGEEMAENALATEPPPKKLNLDMSHIVDKIYLKHSDPERLNLLNNEYPDIQIKHGPLEIQVAKLLQKVALEEPEKLNETQMNLKTIIQDMQLNSKGLLINGLLDKSGKLLNKIIEGNPKYASQSIKEFKKLRTGKKKFVRFNKEALNAEIDINADPLFYRLKQKIPAISKIIDHLDLSHQSSTFVDNNGISVSPVHNTKLIFNSLKPEHGISTELDYTTCDPSLGFSVGNETSNSISCESTRRFSGKVETEVTDRVFIGTKGEISVAPTSPNSDSQDIKDKQIGIYIRLNN